VAGKYIIIMENSVWDKKYTALATYNAEVSRGIKHTKIWADKMRLLQQEYDQEIKDWAHKHNVSIIDA